MSQTQRGQLKRDDSNFPVGWNYRNITGQATTVIKSGPGVLGKVIINQPANNATITIYDNTAASGTKIATITLPASIQDDVDVLTYNVAFNTGLTVVTAVADENVTITYI